MSMRQLTEIEQDNVTYLSRKDIEFSFLLPTATGLKKSIMDAVFPLRDYLLKKGIHSYADQLQGPSNKVCFNAVIVGVTGVCSSVASLYRPETKQGDPRIWFSHLKSQVSPNDMLAIAAAGNVLYVLNLSSSQFHQRASIDDEFACVISELCPSQEVSGTASELLAKMKKIARAGFIPAECIGDTAVGRTLESALGLTMNSSPLPDYKGIELKSKRGGGSSTRKTLFAKVPDWNISTLKSFREFLDAYGYDREGLRRLNCTVNALQRNPQGLKLAVDYGLNLLIENGSRHGAVQNKIFVWTLLALQEKLAEKHKETFWVAAETRTVSGREEFLFKSVEYTRSPHIYQLPDLLAMGLVTVDHLIKEKGASAHERGPLFKVNKTGFQLLFPAPRKFDLM